MLIRIATVLLAAVGLPLRAEETRSAKPTPAKTGAAKTVVDPTPKAGIQRPGVKIAVTRLKAEAEIAGAPSWMIASDGLLVPSANGEALERVDLKTNKRGEPIAGVTTPCAGAVSAFKSLWVTSCTDGSVLRMEPKSGKLEATLKTGVDAVHSSIAATSDSVWILTDGKTTLSRVDPESNAVVGEVRLPAGCANLQFGEASLWVTCLAEDKLLRINPITNLVEQRIKVAAKPGALAFGDGSVWVLGLKDGKIDRIDPKTNKVTKTIDLEIPGTEGSLAFGEGALWASLTGFPLVRIETTAEKEAVPQQFWGDGGGLIVASGGSLWLSNIKQATLWRLDPKRVIATLAE